MQIIIDRIRDCARKFELKKSFTEEDKIFIKNVLLEYADKLTTKNRAGANVDKSDDIEKIKHREKVLRYRTKKHFEKLLGLAGDTNKDPAEKDSNNQNK